VRLNLLTRPKEPPGIHVKKNPPRITSGGNGKPFFGGYAGLRRLGLSFKAPQPVKLGLSGFGGASVLLHPMLGWLEDHDTWRPESLHRRFFEVRERSPRRLRVTSSPGASLHPARFCRRCVRLFAESVNPSDHVGETFGIPSTSLTTPSVLLKEGSVWGSGALARPLTEA